VRIANNTSKALLTYTFYPLWYSTDIIIMAQHGI